MNLTGTPANDTTPDPEATVYHRGEHADGGLTSAQIAAFIRADIKAAMAAGGLPKMKVSIRSERYSMGQSVNIVITSAPFVVLNEERVRWEAANPYENSRDYILSPRARQVEARIEAIAAEYVRSETHSPSDLHNTNCFVSVRYDSDLFTRDREAILAAGV